MILAPKPSQVLTKNEMTVNVKLGEINDEISVDRLGLLTSIGQYSRKIIVPDLDTNLLFETACTVVLNVWSPNNV